MGSSEKNRVIVQTVLAGKSLRETAEQYGVSKVWVHKLLTRYKAGGWQALEPRSRAPHNPAGRISDDLTTQICQLRTNLQAQGLDAGAHTIRAYLLRAHGTSPAASTIWRVLTREGLITPQPRKRPRSSYIRFEADLPNQCWQADFTHWHLADGTDTNILLFVDDHSRYLIDATCHKVVTGAHVLTRFRTAIATHGTPASTLTDNGFVFTTRHRHGPNAFEQELARLGITQNNGTPNHPQTQGKVERLNQTLKRWLSAQPPAPDLATLQTQIDTFTHHYNNHRPHRSLAGQTPQQAYTARAKATPTTHQDTSTWRTRTNKVSTAGNVTIRINARLHHIGLGKRHAGTPIELLIHNHDVIIIDTRTGEILRELTIDTTRDYQPLGTKPGPPKGTPRPPRT